MAPRKPTVDYSGLVLPSPPEPDAHPAPGRKPAAGTRVVDLAVQLTSRIHPDGHLAIKRYCVEAGIKPNDFVVAALEREFKRLGIAAPIRVRSQLRRPGDPDPHQTAIEDATAPAARPAGARGKGRA